MSWPHIAGVAAAKPAVVFVCAPVIYLPVSKTMLNSCCLHYVGLPAHLPAF